MSDTSSIASFEELSEPQVEAFQTNEERKVERLRALVSRSAGNGGPARQLADDETPDVCYILQYKSWGGKLHNSEC